MKKVSVIIAVYNVESYLKKCIDSVIHQTYPQIEIIAVNDGSTDNSLDLLREITKSNSKIIILDKPNGGLADARNAGMKVATGDYIAFLDGDDYYHIDYLSSVVTVLEKDETDLVCSNYTYCWLEDIERQEEKKYLEGVKSILCREEAISLYLQQKIIGSVTIKLFKRSICQIHSLKFPKGQMWEDMTFTFNYLLNVDKVSVLNNSFYYYVQSEKSITRSLDTLNILDIITATKNSITINKKLYPHDFINENKCYFTKSFIVLLVYTFKCKNPEIHHTLKQALKENYRNTGLSLLKNKEKMLIILYRFNYSLARWVYFKIYKRERI